MGDSAQLGRKHVGRRGARKVCLVTSFAMELGFVHCIYRLLFPAKLVTALAKPSGHEHHQDNNVMRIGNAGKIVRLSGFPGSPSM